MAREFPTFLFDNPQNTKNKGPFIVRTIYPKALFYVTNEKHPTHRGSHHCIIIEKWDKASEQEYEEAQLLANSWFDRQLKSGNIKI